MVAHADIIIPPPTAIAAVSTPGGSFNTGSVLTAINDSSAAGYAVSVNYFGGGIGDWEVGASGTAPSVGDSAGLTFSFNVSTTTNTTATVDITSALSTSVSGTGIIGGSEAWIQVQSLGDLVDVCSQSGETNFCKAGENSNFSGKLVFTVPTNTLQTVFIHADGSIGAGASNGSWNALVDPSITLDPLDTSGGTLQLSADLPGSISPVPIPATAWLLFSGVIGLALLRRRAQPA